LKIEYSSKATRQLERLRKQKSLLVRLFAAIDELEANPYAGKPLEGEHTGALSLRVGDWRVIYEVDSKTRQALIVRVAKRGEVYR